MATAGRTTSWAYTEAFVPEDDVLAAARQRATEVGAAPVSAGAGATLRLLAATLGARAVVEVSGSCGVAGLWLLRGMADGGVLTSIDAEAEHQRLARQGFNAAGVPANRARPITGRALDVLPRLTDGAYDLVYVDADPRDDQAYLEQALRLLRPGGVFVLDNALWHDRVADPAQRDPETVAMRELGRALREDERLVPVLLPVGGGLLAAVVR